MDNLLTKPAESVASVPAALAPLIDWITETARAAHGLLVPVSGGSDSALAFYLCSKAYPEKTLGVYAGENLRAREWLESVGNVRILPAPTADFNAEVARFATFLNLSLSENRWLVGTRNRSEDMLGSYSMASRVATYMPIIGLWKSQVMEFCDLIGVPAEVTASSRRADPNCGRPQELSEIPLELIDVFLKVKAGVLTEDALTALRSEQADYLEHVLAANQFKQYLPTKGPAIS